MQIPPADSSEDESPGVVLWEKTGADKILYQKNIEEVLPIASLTKLMTGLIVIDNLNLNQTISISQSALAAYGDNGGLIVDEKISAKNLLYVMLMESSNDAALAFDEAFHEKGSSLTELMNQQASSLGLEQTNFTEPSGYQPDNLSNALDLAKLVKYTLKRQLFWQILGTKTIDLFSVDNSVNHHLTNTNQLLDNWPNILGGKTGYTEEAEGCLILVIEQPLDKTHWIMDKWGYTGSACIPMALDDAVEKGLGPKPGDNVLFIASGGGISMACTVWKWTA